MQVLATSAMNVQLVIDAHVSGRSLAGQPKIACVRNLQAMQAGHASHAVIAYNPYMYAYTASCMRTRMRMQPRGIVDTACRAGLLPAAATRRYGLLFVC